MTMITESFAPWLRDLNRLLAAEGAVAGFVPPADIIVHDDGVTVYIDVPGLDAGSVEIEIENDVLTVRGERRPPAEVEDGERTMRHIERRFGKFERSLRVPSGLDPDAIDAALADGVLTLRVPKPETAKPHRVQIKAGSPQPELQESAS